MRALRRPASKSPISLVILPPRAQASRRCETQAPLSGKPPSCTSVSVPRPLPRAPETWSQATGRRTAFRSEQRNRQQTKRNYLTRKAPYKFESISLQRGVCKLSFLARCHCDGETRLIALAYGKFESSSLQQRVRCELDLAARKSQKGRLGTRAASAAHTRMRPRPQRGLNSAGRSERWVTRSGRGGWYIGLVGCTAVQRCSFAT
jgi:hypothetical protein